MSKYPITIDGESVWIGTAAELSVALDVLQGQRDRQVLTQLQPHLARVIPRAKDFMAVMKSLSPDDQVFLIEALGPDLAGILEDAAHMRDLLATLAEEKVEIALLKMLGPDGLRALLLTAPEAAEVLEWVYGQTDQLALDLLGLDYIRRLLRNADDLAALLRSLDNALQEKLIDQLGWEFALGLVRNGRDLAALLRALPAAVSERLLKHYNRAQLASLIGNAHDWTYLYQRLEPAEAETLIRLLGLKSKGGKSHAA
ncbi:MAG TPA: hypothetical protein VMC09_08620 [Anaerolineales bacterium]|nr:hypothetical protein [Anaerolineales bacterium]